MSALERRPGEPSDEWLAEQYPQADGPYQRTLRYAWWWASQPSPMVRLMLTREEFCESWPWEDPDEYGLPFREPATR